MKTSAQLLLTAVALACTQVATAQDNAALRSAAQRAIATNPEVTARYNAFLAARDEVDVARGAYYPRVDLSAEVGRTRDTIESPSRLPPESRSLTNTQAALSATQLLWDGWSARDEVSRLGHARVTRYFEFLDASEQTALEAARAYHDVQRYRRLKQLAEDNYVQHKYVETQVGSRVKAGVGRGVDAEQAQARLALAESNLATENANLYDVSERFRRIVGEQPAGELPATQLQEGLPVTASNAVIDATTRSPAVSAAIENLRAVREQASSVEGSGYHPRVEARLRGGLGHNLDRIEDQKREVSGAIVLNWNLYRGGSDQARVRQYANLVNQAADQRDKACRDARQTAAIAYNDTAKLTEQLAYLNRNEQAIAKARDAYRQQFDIGQRSLLDLLNAENELYTARRAVANAQYDLSIAQSRTLAATGQLVQRLGLAKAGQPEDADQVKDWSADGDEGSRCPVDALSLGPIDKAGLDARAQQMIGAPTQRPVAVVPVPAPVVAPPPPAPPATAPAAAPAEFATQRLRDWVAAWNSKQVSNYIGFYSKDFRPAKAGGRAKWLAERRRLVGKKGPIDVSIDNINARTLSPTQAETEFDQIYKSNDYSDTMRKALTWENIGGEWYIVSESNR